MITVPSLLLISFALYNIGGYPGLIIIGIGYLGSLFNVLRMCIKVSFTDPGIIPKVKSDLINYSVSNQHVSFREGVEIKVSS
jgi:hypothetical protein